MKTDIVRQDPVPTVGHEIKHGLENYIEVLNNPNMNAQYLENNMEQVKDYKPYLIERILESSRTFIVQ